MQGREQAALTLKKNYEKLEQVSKKSQTNVRNAEKIKIGIVKNTFFSNISTTCLSMKRRFSSTKTEEAVQCFTAKIYHQHTEQT